MSQAAMQEQLCCSFCGKLSHEVRTLIEGGCARAARVGALRFHLRRMRRALRADQY